MRGCCAHRVLICDRDAKGNAEVRRLLGKEGIRVVQTPRRAPNANAYAYVLSGRSTMTLSIVSFRSENGTSGRRCPRTRRLIITNAIIKGLPMS